jgi:hypothetical protein
MKYSERNHSNTKAKVMGKSVRAFCLANATARSTLLHVFLIGQRLIDFVGATAHRGCSGWSTRGHNLRGVAALIRLPLHAARD